MSEHGAFSFFNRLVMNIVIRLFIILQRPLYWQAKVDENCNSVENKKKGKRKGVVDKNVTVLEASKVSLVFCFALIYLFWYFNFIILNIRKCIFYSI